MEVISFLARGGGREPLLQIAREINRSYEKVLYSFRKLKKEHAFLLQIAQPSPDMFNLHMEFVILKTSITFQKLSSMVSGIGNIPYLATDDADTYFFMIISTGMDDYKTAVETLYRRLGDTGELRIIHGKGWEFANRFQLKRLYGVISCDHA